MLFLELFLKTQPKGVECGSRPEPFHRILYSLELTMTSFMFYIIILLLIFNASLSAQAIFSLPSEPLISLRQSVQSHQVSPSTALLGHSGALFFSDTRLRLDYQPKLATDINLDFALESTWLSFSGPRNFSSLSFADDYPFEKFARQWTHRQSASTIFFTRLERFNLRYRQRETDIIFGRQAISLGTSHFVGVLDVLAPFATGSINNDYKIGIDALRLQRPLGDTAEHELIFALSEEWSDQAFLYRQRALYDRTDWEFVGGRVRGRNFAGLGFEGESGRFAVWGEGAVFERKLQKELWRSGHESWAFSFVSGFDYHIRDGMSYGLGFLYQDFGTRLAQEIPMIRLEAPFRERVAQLAGQRYIVAHWHQELKPLVYFDINTLLNIDDDSVFMQPKLHVNLSDQTDLTLFAWLGFGQAPLDTGGVVTTIRSEFGGINEGFGFFVRFYF